MKGYCWYQRRSILQAGVEGNYEAWDNWTPGHAYQHCNDAAASRHKTSPEQGFCDKHVFRGGNLDVCV